MKNIKPVIIKINKLKYKIISVGDLVTLIIYYYFIIIKFFKKENHSE